MQVENFICQSRRTLDHQGNQGSVTATRLVLFELVVGHAGDSHSTAKSMAESIRRATHRLDSKGMSEPLHHPKRSPSQENLVFLFPLLPPIENPLGPRKQCPFPRQASKIGRIVPLPQLERYSREMAPAPRTSDFENAGRSARGARMTCQAAGIQEGFEDTAAPHASLNARKTRWRRSTELLRPGLTVGW
jgi:hypothetical protein